MGNANFFSVFLASPDIRTASHARAEQLWLYRMGHPLLVDTCQYLDDPDRIGAVSHGITTYESIGLLLRQTSDFSDLSVDHVGAIGFNIHDLNSLLALLDDSRAEFAGMANTAEIVAETAEYTYPGMGEFAICGAALARRLELEVV